MVASTVGMVRLTPVSLFVIAAAMVQAGCGDGESPTAPSSTQNAPTVIQGSVNLRAAEFAVLNVTVGSAGTLITRVDWTSANNDLDSAIVRNRCTPVQLLAQSQGCNEAASVTEYGTRNKPSMLSISAQAGDHTVVIFNRGPATDTASYRLEGVISGASTPSTVFLPQTE